MTGTKGTESEKAEKNTKKMIRERKPKMWRWERSDPSTESTLFRCDLLSLRFVAFLVLVTHASTVASNLFLVWRQEMTDQVEAGVGAVLLLNATSFVLVAKLLSGRLREERVG